MDLTQKTTSHDKTDGHAMPAHKDSENYLRSIFSQAPVAICIFRGPTFIVEMANERMLRFWDREAEQVLNKPVFESMPDLTGQGYEALLKDVYQTGNRFVAEEIPLSILRRGKPEEVFIKLVYEPMREEDGTVYAVMALAYEITEQVSARKKIEESEAFNKTLLESSPDCVKVLDADGQLQFMNTNGLCLLEIDDFTPFKNIRWSNMWGEESRQVVEEAVTKALNGKTAHFQAFNPTTKGTAKWWDVIVSPVLEKDDKKISRIISVSRDITEQKQASIKLEESYKRYQQMFIQSPFGFSIMKGEDMKITLANELMKEYWGKGADVEEKTLLEVLPELWDQPFPAMIRKVYETGVPVTVNEILARLLHKGKMEDRYFNIVYQPQLEADETISGVVTIAYEVTELVIARKKMEAQAAMVSDLLMTAPGFVATLTGPDHVYGLVNAQYQSLFGQRKIQGKAMLEALPELEGQGFNELLDTVYNTGETYMGIDIPIVLARDENLEPELRYFNFSYQPMYDENKTIFSILVFGYEVTEQVLAKNKSLEEHEVYATMLEERVKDRTLELSEANYSLSQKNDELKKMNVELESFTYISSHDLQEPLRKIQTFAARILEKDHHVLSDTGKDYFKRMTNAAARMQTLIEDLLAYSQTSISERKLESTDLTKIVEEVKEELTEAILEKAAVIEAGDLDEAAINPFQFRQVLHNLISNALKFSKPGVPPLIKIGSEINEGINFQNEGLYPEKTYCHISFSDNGIGFDLQYKEKIFDVFQRLHGKEEYAGTGIGLAIVKKIIENHNGIITAASRLGEGARFDVYLPA